MANPFLEQKYQEFLVHLRKKSVYELTNDFNKETSHNGWAAIRGSYLEALREAFREKRVDISQVETERGYSLRYPVYYRESDHKLIQIKQVFFN